MEIPFYRTLIGDIGAYDVDFVPPTSNGTWSAGETADEPAKTIRDRTQILRLFAPDGSEVFRDKDGVTKLRWLSEGRIIVSTPQDIDERAMRETCGFKFLGLGEKHW